MTKKIVFLPPYNHKGFILAETLITLVIVGVIAAITVPSLIAKYHNVQLKTQFKRSYSLITQSINKVNMLEFSGNVFCEYGDNHSWQDCSEFFRYFPKYLSISKICNGNAKTNCHLPDYNQYPEQGCPNFNKDNIDNIDTIFILTSGEIIVLYGNIEKKLSIAPLILVDINGVKGPNKLGYDLFGFAINRSIKSGLYLTSHGCVEQSSQGGRTTSEMMNYAFAGKE